MVRFKSFSNNKNLNQLLNLSIEVHFVIENCYLNNLNQINDLNEEIKLCHLLNSNINSPLIH